MLSRAMHDARREASTDRRSANGKPATAPRTASRVAATQSPKANATQAKAHASGRGYSASQLTLESEENTAPTFAQPAEAAWHQKLIERFFAAPAPADPLKKNGRLYFVLILFLCGFLAVLGKLFKVQVLNHDAFSKQADSQYKMQVATPAKRGVIRDRNGVILAANAYVVKFAVDPRALQHPDKLAEAFAKTFNKPAKTYLDLFRDTTKRYVVLEKEVPQEIASTLDSIKERGLIREVESRRHYAFDERAAHIVGFSSKDGRGLAGIELLENHELGGVNGFQIMQRDGRGIRRPDVDYEAVPAKDGEDITLTIDESIQSTTEAALKAGVTTAMAEAGIVIVMKPKTGEILALANYPDFNPNAFGKAGNDALRDRAITDAFEPGSTIKVITAASALEDGVMKPDDHVDAGGGTWSIDGAKIVDTHHYGVLTFRAALEKSSNVCFAKISDKIERKSFYKHLRDFGIGVLSGIDLPGEIKGYLRKPTKWGVNSKRYMAFGYELTATPLQMAVAYATVANMGVMMKPYVIAKRSNMDGTIEEIAPQEIRRVVSEKTARTLIGMMCGVVDSGTATTARIKGVEIAGKTGTAQQLVNGHYSKDHYTSSFTGFFPAQNPEYLILVILRSPHNGYYGGAVSAPIFREIAMRILEMNGKLPIEAKTTKVSAPMVDEGGTIEIDGTVLGMRERETSRDMPEVRGLTLEAGKSLLASQGFVVLGGSKMTGMIDRVEKVGGDTVRCIVSKQSEEGDPDQVEMTVAPDFVGMPLTRALRYGTMNGIRTKAVGKGNVVKQFPLAGIAIDSKNPVITLFGEE
jgi:cell division protein FtsI (penicillin-binding protein 3)